MKSYVLSFSGSGETSEINAANDDAAIKEAINLLGEDTVVAEQWDADGYNDDDKPCKRILFWADEESAENDAGANAIAQLSTVGNA